MKKRILTIALSLITVGMAYAREGFYAGGEVGAGFFCRVPSKAQLREDFGAGDVKSDKGRVLAGVFGGYTWDINEEWTIAPQVGFRYIQKAKYRANGPGTVTVTNALDYDIPFAFLGAPLVGHFEGSHAFKVIDVLAVAAWHFHPQWDMQLKAGGAVVMDRIKYKSTATTSAAPGQTFVEGDYSKSFTRVRPEVGVGVGYWLNETVRISLDGSYIFGKRSRANTLDNFKKIPSLATATVGIQYLF